MLRKVRISLATRAVHKAVAKLDAYQSQPPGGSWSVGVAMMLGANVRRAEQALLRVVR